MQSHICNNSPQKHQQSDNLGYISKQAELSLIFNNSINNIVPVLYSDWTTRFQSVTYSITTQGHSTLLVCVCCCQDHIM